MVASVKRGVRAKSSISSDRAQERRRARQRKRVKNKTARALSTSEEIRLTNHLDALCCSMPWMEHATTEVLEQGMGQTIIPRERAATHSQLALWGIYPPDAPNTPMRRCHDPACKGRFYPAHSITVCVIGGQKIPLCEDCRSKLLWDKHLQMKQWEGNEEEEALTKRLAFKGEGVCAPPDVLNRLKELGLTDREIAVLARSCERPRPSDRQIAEMCDISGGYVSILRSSAMNKLAKQGLSFQIPIDGEPPEVVLVDPADLDRRPAEKAAL